MIKKLIKTVVCIFFPVVGFAMIAHFWKTDIHPALNDLFTAPSEWQEWIWGILLGIIVFSIALWPISAIWKGSSLVAAMFLLGKKRVKEKGFFMKSLSLFVRALISLLAVIIFPIGIVVSIIGIWIAR
jgi:cytosine/uracil/thiamine/allantoin permease